jgi:hypothetical protein
VAAHTVVDFTAVGLLHAGEEAWGGAAALLATEALVAVYALLAVWFIISARETCSTNTHKPDGCT